MCRRMLASAVIAVALAAVAAFSAAASAAESPSALLEKAIYTEETVGDLDAAAKLYGRRSPRPRKRRPSPPRPSIGSDSAC